MHRAIPIALAAAGVATSLVTTTPAAANTPITPMLAVTINARAGQRPVWTVTAQAPTWSCVEQQWGSGTFELACRPAAAPTGFVNTCVWSAVEVTSLGIPGHGNLTAEAQCDSAAPASATAPSGTSNAAASLVNAPLTTFYCRLRGGVTEPGMRPWATTCTHDH